MTSSSGSRMDWHGSSPRSPYHSEYNSHSSNYESQQQPEPPPDMRSPYDYPHPRLSSRSGGAVPSTPPPPADSYWYEGRSGDPHRRRPPMATSEGWNYHSANQEYEPPYEHGMPPPSQSHQGYPYHYSQEMHQGPSHRRRDSGGRGWPSPPQTSYSKMQQSMNSHYPPYYRRNASNGSSSAPTRDNYASRASSQSRTPTKNRDENPSHDKKNGKKEDPLSFLAKVSSSIRDDGSKKQGGGRDAAKSAEKLGRVPKEVHASYAGSPPREKTGQRPHSHHATPSCAPKPREVTPTAPGGAEHPDYHHPPPRGAHPQEYPYYSQSEQYYSRHSPRPSHGHPYPHDPQPQHFSHQSESGWGSQEGPNGSPPPLVQRSPSFEGQEMDHRYPYYPPPPPTPPSFEPPYEHPSRGPPPPSSHWNEYPSGSAGHSGARVTTPPSTPPHHVYPPPRWSYEFGRAHRDYPPAGQPRRISDEPPRPPLIGGESTRFSTKNRGSYHGESAGAPPSYPQPHHSYPYHEHAPHPRTPAKDKNREKSGYSYNGNNNNVYSPYTYVQQPHAEEKTVLRKKFSWKHYPELEQFLITHRDEYLRHSNMNYTAEQKHYNNWLTDRLLEVAEEHNYAFDPDDFNFVAIRDRIRCYYKSYVQTARKRGISLSHEDGKEGSKKKPRIPSVITTTAPTPAPAPAPTPTPPPADTSSKDDNNKKQE